MDSFEKELSENLSEIYKNVTRLEENALQAGDINLTIAEVNLVSVISKYDRDLTVSDLAKMMCVTKPTVTATVNRIVKKGYAYKEVCKEDARQIHVKLSEEGKRVVILHKKCQRDVIKKLGNEFSKEQRDVLMKAIKKLNLYFKPEEV